AGLIRPGSIVVQTAFGGGVTWGSTVTRWGERVEPLGGCDAALPACDETVFDLLAPNRDFYAPLHPDPAVDPVA
ncbi:MAG: 3-oxoacyl-ACP synthase, partial [Acidimicrobiaceae bacterium]|nr:3-oxoacyl-ACP synthase [Acidimicrobiaceae bacterium]